MTADEWGEETWHRGSSSNTTKLDFADGNHQAIQEQLDDLLCKRPNSVPIPESDGWTKVSTFNCWGGHGAKDLENPPHSSCGSMTVAACQAKCDSLAGCTGIVTGQSDSNGNVDCYRKGDIQLENCDNKTSFNTYVKSEWTKAKGFNCWGPRGSGSGHGAFDLEHPETSSAGNMSLAACQDLCKKTSGCEGITV